MLENLKKYWFIGLIVLVMVIGTVLFSKEQLDAVFKGKKVDGKDLIYEISDEYKTADEYYETIFKTYGGSEGYKLFERLVLDSIETSDEIREESLKKAEEHRKGVAADGTQALKDLETALIHSGYKGLDELNVFYENNAKLLEIQRNYIEAQDESYLDSYFKDKAPRIVSHILIKMDDSKNPTDEQKKLMEEVDNALADGMSFKDAAMKFSDDGSASEGGYIGYLDSDSKFVKEFIDTAIVTKAGERSAWFATEYGQHIIEVESDDYESLITEDAFVTSVVNYKPEVLFQSIWEKAQDLEIVFTDKELEKQIKEYMKIEGVE